MVPALMVTECMSLDNPSPFRHCFPTCYVGSGQVSVEMYEQWEGWGSG